MTTAAPPSTTLRAGTLHLPALLMQGISHIAPAVGLLLSIQQITSHAGRAAPLAYGVAFVMVLLLGISLSQLARELPSAGGYYTYVSRTVHKKAGFLTAWIYFLYDPTSTAINLAFAGAFFEPLFQQVGIVFPWWAFFLSGTALVTLLCYRGIEVSARTMAIFCALEVAITVALCGFGVISRRDFPVDAAPFSVGQVLTDQGLYLGVAFSIFAFSGFESVVPLAEESVDPRRNLPRSILWSILLMGAFYVFCSYALLAGWGTGNVAGFVASQENPALVLARRLWGAGWLLLPLAVLNSIVGVCIACTNAATRVFYAMGRAGSLPRALSTVHPRFATPWVALLLQTGITLVLGLGLGFLLGPKEEFFFMGLVITLGLSVVYCMGNLGVFLFYYRPGSSRHEAFHPFLHVVCPLLSTLSLLYVAYKSTIPLPKGVERYAPVLVGAWLLVGGVVVIWKKRL